MPNPASKPSRTPSPQPRRPQPATSGPEVVDPSWILKAFSLTVAFALLCAFGLLCVTFHYTQWQFVLRPTHTPIPAAALADLPHSDVRFGPDASGQPQLSGLWIPADTSTDTTPTALILPSGQGDLAESALPDLHLLHAAGLNILAFDYRGYGASGTQPTPDAAGQHPTQALMQSDAESALAYLTSTRNLPLTSIIVYATGLGASLAVHLCADHPAIPALILNAADGDTTSRVAHDPRAKLVPARLLFTQTFPLAHPLQTLPTPKLLITTEESSLQQTLHQAANPKMIVTLNPRVNTDLQPSLHRFLDTYTPRITNH